jgi:hypothetical protein
MNNDILLNKIIYKVLNEQTNLETLIRQVQNEQTATTGGDDFETMPAVGTQDPEASEEDLNLSQLLDDEGIPYVNIDSTHTTGTNLKDIDEDLNKIVEISLPGLEDELSGVQWLEKNVIELTTVVGVTLAYLFVTGRLWNAKMGNTLLAKLIKGMEKKLAEILFPAKDKSPTLWSQYVSNNIRKILAKGWLTSRWADTLTQIERKLALMHERGAITSTTKNQLIQSFREINKNLLEESIRAKLVDDVVKKYRKRDISASEAITIYNKIKPEIISSDAQTRLAFKNLEAEIAAHETETIASIHDIEVGSVYTRSSKTQQETLSNIKQLEQKKQLVKQNPAGINDTTKKIQQEIDTLQTEIDNILYKGKSKPPNATPDASYKNLPRDKKAIVDRKQIQIQEKQQQLELHQTKAETIIDKEIKLQRNKLKNTGPVKGEIEFRQAAPNATITKNDIQKHTQQHNVDYWKTQYTNKELEQFTEDFNTLVRDSKLKYRSEYQSRTRFPSAREWQRDLELAIDNGIPKQDLVRMRNGKYVPDLSTQYNSQKLFWELNRLKK